VEASIKDQTDSRQFGKQKFKLEYPIPLTNQIAESLTNAIVEGTIEEGARLVETELQKIYGVSRAPIREAFRILEKNELVVVIPRKGTFVRKIDEKDIAENFSVRILLEDYAAGLAVDNLKDGDIATMKSIYSKMEQAIKDNDLSSYVKYHGQFHAWFINASGNSTIIKILDTLRSRALRYRAMREYYRKNSKYSIDVHKQIWHAFEKRDRDHVQVLVKEHLQHLRDWFYKNRTKGFDETV